MKDGYLFLLKNNYLIQSASESEKLKIKESGATTLEKAKESQLEIAPFNPNDPNMKKQTKNEIEEMAKNSKLKKNLKTQAKNAESRKVTD